MPSQLTVHFYLPDATRTACKLPIRGVNLISRCPDQTECPACIETPIWEEEAAARVMERALSSNIPPIPVQGPIRRVELPGGSIYEVGPAQYFGKLPVRTERHDIPLKDPEA